MNKKEFEKFITLENYFREIYFYEENQSVCNGYPLEDFYPGMTKLYSTNNQYFPLVLMNKQNDIFLIDRDNELNELENNIYYLPFYLFMASYVEEDKVEVTILNEDDRKYFTRQCENLKSFFSWLKDKKVEMNNMRELENLIKNINLALVSL